VHHGIRIEQQQTFGSVTVLASFREARTRASAYPPKVSEFGDDEVR